MADHLTEAKRSENMRAIKSGDTSCELALRKAAWQAGLRGYRVHHRGALGKPDLAYTKHKVAVFVDGCFWHGCPGCSRIPKTNSSYWQAKISRNIARGQKVTSGLNEQGWTVLRFWEHEIQKDLASCVDRIRQALNEKRQDGLQDHGSCMK